MQLRKLNELAVKVFGENYGEIIEFLEKESPEKNLFWDEKSFINHISRILIGQINPQIQSEKNEKEFWDNGKQSLMHGRLEKKPKNILYAIRLLNGKIQPGENQEEWSF